MGTYDFEEKLSDSDGDDFLQEEIRALSMALMPPSNANAQEVSEDYDDDDVDDDLELVRRIKEQYGIGADIGRPLSLKPLTSLPPVSDDDDDDFETLRAIQSRFYQYCGNAPPPDEVESKNGDSRVEKPLNSDSLGSESLGFLAEDIGKDVCDAAENSQISSCTSSFPEAAQTFVEAIKRNRSCQKFLRTKMLHIEARMEEIKDVQKRLKTLRDFQVQCKKKIGRALSQKQDARVQLITAPKQRAYAKGTEKNVSAIGPSENSHVAVYNTTLKTYPLSFIREKWSKDETRVLQKEIKKQFQERLFQKSADILSALEEPGGANGVDNMISSITNLDITPDIIQEFSGKVDWDQLASRLTHRTGAECEARWLNYENCLINRDKWTSDEEKHLLFFIQKTGLHNWSNIAEKLGTNRTPFQCLAHYQRSLNASILKRVWTEVEDAQLRSAVEVFGESNWQAVASLIEGRTGTQCSNRWNKTLLPARKRVGTWSSDEDKHLRVAVTLFGYKSWNRIANFVPGRTQVQCRERWKNVLDPSLNLGQWTEEEDLRLKEAIAKYGYCWSKIAVCVSSRTDSQCRRRWMKLFPDEVQLLKAAKGIKKTALISNFVDRESERPALGVDAFVPLPTQPQNKSRKRRKANPTRELVSNCKGARSRKRKSSDSSTVDNSHCDEARSGDGCETFENKMRSSSKSGFKRKKASANLNISTEPQKSRTRSRGQGADVKKVALINDRNVSHDTGIHDSVVNTSTLVHSSNQNNDPEVLHGQLTSMSHSEVNEEEMVETSNIVAMGRKKRCCRKQPRSSLAEKTLGDNNYGLMELSTSGGGNGAEFVDAAGKTNWNKKSKLQTDHSLEWQDLPLATLFNKAVNRIRGRISIVRPPIHFTYTRRNKKGTLDSST